MKRLAGLLLTLVAGAALAHGEKRFAGEILGVDGDPMPGVIVAPKWLEQGGRISAPTQTVTDGAGRYALELELHDRPRAVFAMDRAQRWGAIAPIGTATDPAALNATLQPLALVQGSVAWLPVRGDVPISNLQVTVLPHGARVAASVNADGSFRFLLPPGRYRLHARANEEYPDWVKELTVADEAQDLGRIDMESLLITDYYGQAPPPWTLSATRNAPADLSLETHAGKWQLIVFWDARDPVCLGQLMPGLLKFCERFASERERFEVVAIHSPALTSFAAVDAAVAPAKASVWGGKALPFPLALDASGETAKAYGIERSPTILLVDPDGALLRRGGLQTLAEALKR